MSLDCLKLSPSTDKLIVLVLSGAVRDGPTETQKTL